MAQMIGVFLFLTDRSDLSSIVPPHLHIRASFLVTVVEWFCLFFFVSLTWGCGVNVDSFIGLFLPCSLCELFFRYNSHHSYLNFSLRLSVSVTLSARVPPQ